MAGAYPRHPGYHPHEPYGRPDFRQPSVIISDAGPKPEAIIYEAVKRSRKTEADITLVIAVDHSGSTNSTDPDGARTHDELKSLDWAVRNLRPSDRIVRVGFTDDAVATGSLATKLALEAARAGHPGSRRQRRHSLRPGRPGGARRDRRRPPLSPAPRHRRDGPGHRWIRRGGR